MGVRALRVTKRQRVVLLYWKMEKGIERQDD
jgi:hypothetical protein